MSLLPPVLLVDDSADDRELIGLVLTGAFGPVEIEEAGDAAALARAVGAGRFGAVLTEHELSWIRSSDVARLVRDLRPGCPVVVVTGAPIERVAAEVLHLEVDGLVPKTSAGLTALPRVLRTALFETRRRTAAAGPDAPSRRLLDALPAGVFVATAEGTLLDVNPAFAATLGFERREDAVQRALDGLFVLSAEGEALREAVATGGPAGPGGSRGPGTAVEVRLRRVDGSTVWARVTAWRGAEVAGTHGRLEARIEGLLEERGAARSAEEALAERSAALARSNAELDEMAYVVSHDLRKPLTQVIRFLDLLERDAGSRLEADQLALLTQARGGAGRLEGMVEAVLRCARIDSRGEAFAPVDLSAVLDRVAERLADEFAAVGGELTRDRLPTLSADESQLEQLFQNLLDNAIKFRGASPLRLVVAAAEEGDSWHLEFRDNGIGVDPADAERIFVMFQRLHTEAEIPGSGIGLAVCRRIVARHGGRIWVESRRDAGSIFHVTLAKHATAPRTVRRES